MSKKKTATTSKKKTATTSKKKTATTSKKKTATTSKKKPSTKAAKLQSVVEEGKERKTEVDYSLIDDGVGYIEENKLEAALECFVVFSEQYPDDHLGWYYAGFIQFHQKKLSKAMKSFKKSNRLNKKFLPSIFHQGLIEFEKNNFEKALKIFEKIIETFSSEEIKQSNYNVPYYAAICYQFLGKLERADEYFLFAYNLNPIDATVLYWKGFNELSLEKYDYAIETFKNLLAIDFDNQEFWDLIKSFFAYFYDQKKEQQDIEELPKKT